MSQVVGYDPAVPTSVTSSTKLDVGNHGFNRDDLPEPGGGPLDVRGFFGFPDDASRPLDLEIGSGKGTFLVQQAAVEPSVDFLGIEWAKAFWRHAADRARRNGLNNVRLLWADATHFVRDYVADGTLRRVHIYFPDPWPKARHHKRRSVQAPFLRELHRVLRADGEVRLATDHDDYFAWMQDHAEQVSDLFERRPFERPDSAGDGELVGTNFERKYRREGRPFHAMVLARRP